MKVRTTHAEAVAAAKREIVEDIASGLVPQTVSTFSQLHDYVDANEYGRLCDEVYEEFDPWADDANMEAWQAFCGAVQAEVAEWVAAGRPETA